MATNTQVLNTFKSYIGEGGSRAWKYCGMSGGAWCDAEVSTVFHNAGADSLWFGKQTYCPTTIKLCNANMAMIPPYLSMGGDVIFFDWQPNGVPDHIGMVVSKIDTDKISTIEGNTGSPARVRYKTRPVKYVLGIYRPLYKPTEADKKAEIVCDGNFAWQSIYALQRALKLTADGILGKATVKALQKKAGVTADGQWGKGTSKAVQKMVGTTVDGAFGKNSVIALQKWINKQNATPTPSKQGYTGAFPDLTLHSRQLIGITAKKLAYAKGTSKATYTYPKGKAKAIFTTAINKVYPNRSSWSKQCQAGASCDVGAGTCIRYSGYDAKMPRGLSEQIPHLKKSSLWQKTSIAQGKDMAFGDVGIYSGNGGHIWISLGGSLLAEANHTAKYFEHIVSKNIKKGNHTYYAIFRACHPSVIKYGGEGTEVAKLQKFLVWYGCKLSADGVFGEDTLKAVKVFQTSVGLKADGVVGTDTIKMMKAVKK